MRWQTLLILWTSVFGCGAEQCFNNNPISPVFMIEDDIEERFLQYGNKVAIS